MHALGAVSAVLFIAVSFMLAGVIVFTGRDFHDRHEWRVAASGESGRSRPTFRIHSGRIFCLGLLRVWQVLLALTVVFFFGGGYFA